LSGIVVRNNATRSIACVANGALTSGVMRVVARGLLVLVVSASAVSCGIDSAGLGSVDARRSGADASRSDLPQLGEFETGTGGAGSNGGQDASAASSGAGGDNASGAAGDSASGAAGDNASGAAGDNASGAAGDNASVGGSNGGVAGSSAGTGGAAGSTQTGDAGRPATGDAGGPMTDATDAHPVTSVGCADETREGFKDMAKYPRVAACAGAWQIAGLITPSSLAPQCGRQAGNNAANLAGTGCSVADLCAEGWHVCESAHEVQMTAQTCADALGTTTGPLFFVTRQRGAGTGGGVTCDGTGQTGTNNVYGCGNFGSMADNACAPFTRMLRDADCQANPPWTCVNGPIDYSVSELADITKPGASRGGVLCCR
jgi:hypothetical protein